MPLVALPCLLIFLLWVFPWGQGRRQERKKRVLESVVFSWFGSLCHPCGRQGRRKNEKNTLCKTWFFRGSPTRASMSLCGRQGRRKKQKKHFVKFGFFRGLPIRASMASIWGHGRMQKRKNHVLESVVFSWFADTGLYVTPVGSKEGGKNEKTTLRKTWFFHGSPIRASIASIWGHGRMQKRKKTTC